MTEKGDTADAVGYNLRSAIRLDLGSPYVRINDRWLRRQRELLGDARLVEELLHWQLDETSVANLNEYLSQPSIDDSGLQHHLASWEPIIAAIAAATKGDENCRNHLCSHGSMSWPPPTTGTPWWPCCSGSWSANAATNY